MGITFYAEWTIERGEEPSVDICIDYKFRAGLPAHYGSLTYPGHPAEPNEIEIISAKRKGDPDAAEFEFTDEEREEIEGWLMENPPEPDYPEDF